MTEDEFSPAFLGVGWAPTDEANLKRGQVCPKCGTVGGERGNHVPRGCFCLGCLSFHPDETFRVCGSRKSRTKAGRESKVPMPRLNAEERRAIGATLPGRVYLAQLQADREGRAVVASRYRLWLSLYQDGQIDDVELGRRFEEGGEEDA